MPSHAIMNRARRIQSPPVWHFGHLSGEPSAGAISRQSRAYHPRLSRI